MPVKSKRTALFLQISLIVLGLSCPAPASTVTLDQKNHLVVDGEPFFPIGMYSVKPPTAFEELKKAGFNTVHSYSIEQEYLQTYLNEAEKEGLKAVIFPGTKIMLDEFYSIGKLIRSVKKFKDSGALLVWYLLDEPDLRKVPPSEVERMYEKIKAEDPHHPTGFVLARTNRLGHYAPYTDIVMVDPFPVPSAPLTRVSDVISKARAAVEDKKPVWAVLQAFGYQDGAHRGWGADREPTWAEARCMTYLAIVHGAKGIFYYVYHGSQYDIQLSPGHWQNIKKIAGELETLTPVLLAPVNPEKIGMTILDAPGKDINGDPAVHFIIKKYGGKKYLIAVNVIKESLNVTFSDFATDADSLQVLFEDRAVDVIEGSFTDTFAPYEVHIYTAKPYTR